MKVRGYTFETTVFNTNLSILLGCVSDEFLVMGEYTIDWDGDVPMVNIDDLIVMDENGIEVDSKEFITLYMDEWISEIELSGHDTDWHADYIACHGDMYYDMWKDGSYG